MPSPSRTDLALLSEVASLTCKAVGYTNIAKRQVYRGWAQSPGSAVLRVIA
jgi:hypothetical protein